MPRLMKVVAVLSVAVATPAAAQRTVELPARDVVLRGVPVDVWAVGTDEGEPWEMLAGVRSIAFDAMDNLYALDTGNHRVLVFDREGVFVRSVGARGGGPGEFQAPMAVAVLDDGTIAVLDLARRGFVLFGQDGTYLRDALLPEDIGLPRPGELYVHDDEIIARAMPTLRFGPGAPPDPSAPRTSPIFRMSFREDAQPVTLHSFAMAPPQVRETQAAGGRRMRMAVMSVPTFQKEPSFAVLSGGSLAISDADDYTIAVKDASGRDVRTIVRPIAARPVSERDREAAREQLRRQLREPSSAPTVVSGRGSAFFRSEGTGGGLTDEQIEERVRQMTFHEQIAAIERVWSDPLGRLWVLRRPDRVAGDPVIDLIGDGDRYIGTITGRPLPAAVSANGLAAWVEKDELDIERIVVRRLPGEWK